MRKIKIVTQANGMALFYEMAYLFPQYLIMQWPYYRIRNSFWCLLTQCCCNCNIFNYKLITMIVHTSNYKQK